MNPFTYIKLKFLEAWYDWFEKQSRYVWDRSAERREQQKKEEAYKQAQESVYKINSGGLSGLSVGQNYTNTVIGNGTTYNGFNAAQIAPLTVSQIGQITNLQPYNYTTGQGVLKLNEETNQSQPIQFTIHHANGGKVVEYMVNDGNTRKTKLHVITPEQDLGKELGKIITLELLRN